MINRKSSIGGIETNIVVLVCYLGALLLAWFNDTKFLAWLLPLIIYIVERDNEFIKKHSAQATVLYFNYSFICLVIMFASISMFNISNIFTMNLENFSGSLLLASTLSMVALLLLIIVTILTAIVASKVWHYEDYDIPFVKHFVKSFRRFIDKLIDNGSSKKSNTEDDVIISGDFNINENDVNIEDDSLIIIEKEIEDKKSNKKKKDDK